MIEELKTQIVLLTGVSRDALHTQLGLLIFFLIAIIFRKRAGTLIPVVGVAAAALLVEVFDRARDLSRYGVWDTNASLHDVINTVFWPLVLFVMVRAGIVFKK
jgi:hypothetical protein